MNLKKKLSGLFRSLKPGDLLTIPVPFMNEMFYSTVLRLGDDGEFYVSCPQKEKTQSKSCCCNPIHWDDTEEALVDVDGDELIWYSDDIQVERGAATAIAEEYARIPRVEQVRVVVKDSDIKAFLSSPQAAILRGIRQNGEAGSFPHQLSLVLDLLGIPHNVEQLTALGYFFEAVHAQRAVQTGLNEIIAERASEEEGTDTPRTAPPGCTLQ